MKTVVKKIIPTFVWEKIRYGYAYVRRFVLDVISTAQPNLLGWLRLTRLIRTVRPEYTMVKPQRLRLLYELSRRVNAEKIVGDIVECGVYNGGTAAIMMAGQGIQRNRELWLFDSFEGLPPPTEKDGIYEREHYYKGWCAGSTEKVTEIFLKLRLSFARVHIIKGWFRDTFPREAPGVAKIALLHIDADWYESVKLCLETFYPRVSRGGYIELDDYGVWEGCRKATDEYLAENNIQVELKSRDKVGFYFKKP